MGQGHGFAPRGSHPTAQSDVWKRFKRRAREEGGREEARPDSLPSLPLPVLCKREVFAMSSGGGKTPSCTCLRLDVCWGRDCCTVWPAPGTGSRSCPALHPPSSRCPQQDTPRATPQGSTPGWGHPPVPSWPRGADGCHPAGTAAWRATAPSSRPSLLPRRTWEKTDTQCTHTHTHSQNQPQIWIRIREN